jgi:O-antigen ligase
VFFVMPRLTPVQRMAVIASIALLGFLTLQVPGVATVIGERAGLALSTGGAGRTDIWTVGLNIYKSAPFTGVGLSNFPAAYTPEIVRQSDVGIYSANNPAYRAPHNIVVSTLGELGPVGVFLLAAFLLPLVLRTGWGPDAAMIQATLAALVSTALFLDILNSKQVWLLLGIACGLAYLARGKEFRDGVPALSTTRPR